MLIISLILLPILGSCIALIPSCNFRITEENKDIAPLFLTPIKSGYKFILPTIGRQIAVKSGDNVTLVCADSYNYLENTNGNNTIKATCVNDNLLEINANRSISKFDAFLCREGIRGEVVNTNKSCANEKGHLMNIGFRFFKSSFISLIEICYDSKNAVPLYTKHTLYGTAINFASSAGHRPSWSTEGLPLDVATVAYKQAYQKATFNKLLKSAKISENYIKRRSYLARGHLSPDADFIFVSWHQSTYYYINACPQWQVINNGNWKKVENSVRKASDLYNGTFTVISGTFQVLELEDAAGKLQEIYLNPGGKLVVPKFIWKILYWPKTQEGIVFISLNNPFSTKNEQLCKNICANFGWDRSSWSTPRRGFIHCCDIREFQTKVHHAPQLSIKGILRFPES